MIYFRNVVFEFPSVVCYSRNVITDFRNAVFNIRSEVFHIWNVIVEFRSVVFELKNVVLVSDSHELVVGIRAPALREHMGHASRVN